jgi:hypothetical protein
MKIQIINHHCTIEDISFAYAVHIREEQEETKFRVWAIPAATKRGVRGQDHRSEKRELLGYKLILNSLIGTKKYRLHRFD